MRPGVGAPGNTARRKTVSNNPVVKLNEAYHEFLEGKIDRRGLMFRAGALGLSAASVATFMRGVPASAQDASPVASPTGDLSFNSITAAEATAQTLAAFPMEEAASTGGKVIMGEIASSSLSTTNIILADNSPTIPVMALVFESLVGSSPVDGQYIPGLADHWTIAEDGKTYTFFLREGVTWHDGTPFTADDIIFSMDAQANPETGSSYTSTFVNTVASYKKIDDLTVELVATHVFAQVVFLGSMYAPAMAKHIWENVPVADWATDPGSTGEDPSRVIGTGPLTFVELNTSDAVARFAPYENYYDQKPVFEEFIFQPWPDETSAIEALRAGQIDFYENVPPADVESLQAEDSLDVALYDTYSFGFYGTNLDPEKTTLFQDVKTRQAMAYAIDRQSIVDNIQLGFAEVAQGSQPVLSIAYAPDQITTHYNYDPEKAKQLLADAGWADSDGDGVLELDGEKFEFEIMYGSGSATSDQIVAYIQEVWAAVGIKATPSPVDFSAVLVPAITENFNYQLAFLGFNWDATGDQSAMFSSDQYKTGFNFMKYSNPEVDELNKKANETIDPDARREALIEAANLVNEDLPVLVISFRKDRTGYNTRMHNFYPNALSGLLWSIPYVWIAQ
jgi:peptide/nickel transport system substrate-binding protein